MAGEAWKQCGSYFDKFFFKMGVDKGIDSIKEVAGPGGMRKVVSICLF